MERMTIIKLLLALGEGFVWSSVLSWYFNFSPVELVIVLFAVAGTWFIYLMEH